MRLHPLDSARQLGNSNQMALRQSFVALIMLLAAVLFSSSCSSSSLSGQNAAQATTIPSDISVQISPPDANVTPGASMQFTATTKGSSDSAVRWSTTQGAISNTGFFSVPRTNPAALIVVTATSVANPMDHASALVTVALTKLSIVSNSLPAAQAGVAYTASLQSSGGVAPYSWTITSGSLPSGLTLSSNGSITGATTQSGAFPFSAKVTDASSQTAAATLNLTVDASSSGSNYTGYDGPAQLPLAYMKTSMADSPAPGTVMSVSAGGDLQSALDNANCGDTIQLQAGAVFAGNFTVPAKNCDDGHWIIVRTSTPDAQLPAEGTRMTPCDAGVASLPARPAYPCAKPQKLLATIALDKTGMISGPIQFLAGANHYRFIGLEITRLPEIGSTVDLVAMQDTTKGSGDHIILDRCWIHGTAQDETRRGVALGSMSYVGIVDSYFSDFHCTSISGTCTDASDIGGGAGNYSQSVWKIDDNFLEAAGESILLGGSAATIVPSDIEVRFNHFFKPLTWMKGTPGFVGGADGHPFVVKNHFELKNGTRILLEGNIFDDSWGGFTQHGHSIVLTPRNHYNRTTHLFDCGVCKVTDITIRYSTISHVGAGINLGNPLSFGQPAAGGGRYSIHDITIDDVEKQRFNGGGGLFMIINAWPANELNNIQITHVTGFPDPDGRILALQDVTPNPKIPGFVFTDNIVTVPAIPVFGAGGGSANCDKNGQPISGLDGCFSNYVFTGNVLAGTPKDANTQWPEGNSVANSPAAVGFVKYANGNGGNYALSSSSPYRSTSGSEPGADIATINAEIAGVY
ncbi:MAG TPA: Ig domain-containing protein [Acidobacteriaceae bacterium]|nr:Ig domain-containing protein [Acidobacteriaceae bacterium]